MDEAIHGGIVNIPQHLGGEKMQDDWWPEYIQFKLTLPC